MNSESSSMIRALTYQAARAVAATVEAHFAHHLAAAFVSAKQQAKTTKRRSEMRTAT